MSLQLRLSFVLSLATFAACGGSRGAGPTTPNPNVGAPIGTYSVPDLAGEVTCFQGAGSVEMVNGFSGDFGIYLRRGFDGNTVTEDQVSIANDDSSRGWTTYSANGAALAVEGKYKGGTLAGSGIATGAAPNWTRWIVDTALDVGPKIHSENSHKDGLIKTMSIVSDGNGKQMMRFTAKLAPMEAAACSDQFSRFEPLP